MPPKTKTEAAPTKARSEDDVAKRAARKAAIDALIDAHTEEFEALMVAEHASRNVVWQRRLTPEERAARDAEAARVKAEAKAQREQEKADKALSDLLAKHPGLADRVTPAQG
jgi:hypothetical protein